MAAFSSSSAPSRTSEVSTYMIASDIRVPRAPRPLFGANGAWIKSYSEALSERGPLVGGLAFEPRVERDLGPDCERLRDRATGLRTLGPSSVVPLCPGSLSLHATRDFAGAR